MIATSATLDPCFLWPDAKCRFLRSGRGEDHGAIHLQTRAVAVTICKHGTLTRMLQGVALGRRRKSNRPIDLRVDGITIDETYKDEQYMQRIAEQVQKHVTAKDFFKDDSPKDNILSEQTIEENS